jgi:hypothetical protein
MSLTQLHPEYVTPIRWFHKYDLILMNQIQRFLCLHQQAEMICLPTRTQLSPRRRSAAVHLCNELCPPEARLRDPRTAWDEHRRVPNENTQGLLGGDSGEGRIWVDALSPEGCGGYVVGCHDMSILSKERGLTVTERRRNRRAHQGRRLATFHHSIGLVGGQPSFVRKRDGEVYARQVGAGRGIQLQRTVIQWCPSIPNNFSLHQPHTPQHGVQQRR